MKRDYWLVVAGCTSNNCFVCLAVDTEDPGNVKEPGRARHATDWHASNGSAVDGVEIGTGAARGVSQQTCLVGSEKGGTASYSFFFCELLAMLAMDLFGVY